MNVSLTPQLEQFVNQKVESGKYQTASEVVRDGLRLLLEREERHQKMLDDRRRETAPGSEQTDPGKGTPLEPKETLAQRIQRARQGSRRNNVPFP
jgi:antitoxin ParD1/3/4